MAPLFIAVGAAVSVAAIIMISVALAHFRRQRRDRQADDLPKLGESFAPSEPGVQLKPPAPPATAAPGSAPPASPALPASPAPPRYVPGEPLGGLPGPASEPSAEPEPSTEPEPAAEPDVYFYPRDIPDPDTSLGG